MEKFKPLTDFLLKLRPNTVNYINFNFHIYRLIAVGLCFDMFCWPTYTHNKTYCSYKVQLWSLSCDFIPAKCNDIFDEIKSFYSLKTLQMHISYVVFWQWRLSVSANVLVCCFKKVHWACFKFVFCWFVAWNKAGQHILSFILNILRSRDIITV